MVNGDDYDGGIGGNKRPVTAEDALEALSVHWAPEALIMRHEGLITAAGLAKTTAAAITAVDSAEGAQDAAAAIKGLRDARVALEKVSTEEKAPILLASRAVDGFAKTGAQLKPEQDRVERLVGGFQQREAERRRQERLAAEKAEQARRDELAEAARMAEEAGRTAVAEVLLEQAVKSEDIAAVHAKVASGSINDLARTHTDEGTIGLRSNWTFDREDDDALRATLGPLAGHFTIGAVEAAIRAYITANKVNGEFTGKPLPGVRIFNDIKGNVR